MSTEEHPGCNDEQLTRPPILPLWLARREQSRRVTGRHDPRNYFETELAAAKSLHDVDGSSAYLPRLDSMTKQKEETPARLPDGGNVGQDTSKHPQQVLCDGSLSHRESQDLHRDGQGQPQLVSTIPPSRDTCLAFVQ